MVIVGAGVIGCEYATIFSNFGKTKVYLIDRQDSILPFEDEDISSLVAKNLQENGVTIHHNASLNRMEVVDGKVEYELSYPDGRKRNNYSSKSTFVRWKRFPNIDKINLKAVGVEYNERSGHILDNDTQTNIPNIYAVGDVTGRIALVNMGEIEARHAVEKMFGLIDYRLSYDNVCTIMFLAPRGRSCWNK